MIIFMFVCNQRSTRELYDRFHGVSITRPSMLLATITKNAVHFLHETFVVVDSSYAHNKQVKSFFLNDDLAI